MLEFLAVQLPFLLVLYYFLSYFLLKKYSINPGEFNLMGVSFIFSIYSAVMISSSYSVYLILFSNKYYQYINITMPVFWVTVILVYTAFFIVFLRRYVSVAGYLLISLAYYALYQFTWLIIAFTNIG